MLTRLAVFTVRRPKVGQPQSVRLLRPTAPAVQICRPRPSIILDDDSRFEIDRDSVIGRDPHDVDSGRRGLHPIRIEGPTGGMSREPGQEAWTRLFPSEPKTWRPDAAVLIGSRIFRLQAATNPLEP
jgi:RND superfamily putative drug exporter